MNEKYDYIKRNGILLSILILSLNLFLAKYSFQIIQTGGGPMGIGFIALPFLISYHLFVISSIKEIVIKRKSFSNYVINCIGLIWMLIGCSIIVIMLI